MSEIPAGTAWAYGSHVFVSVWDAAPMRPRICDLDGCVYRAGHDCDHSWNSPYARRQEHTRYGEGIMNHAIDIDVWSAATRIIAEHFEHPTGWHCGGCDWDGEHHAEHVARELNDAGLLVAALPASRNSGK